MDRSSHLPLVIQSLNGDHLVDATHTQRATVENGKTGAQCGSVLSNISVPVPCRATGSFSFNHAEKTRLGGR